MIKNKLCKKLIISNLIKLVVLSQGTECLLFDYYKGENKVNPKYI